MAPPGSPNTVRTPSATRLSQTMRDPLIFMGFPFPCYSPLVLAQHLSDRIKAIYSSPPRPGAYNAALVS